MATIIKNEQSIKNLETEINGYKLLTEVRLDGNNAIKQVNIQVQDSSTMNHIGNYSGNDNAGKLYSNISVQDDAMRTVCSEMFDTVLKDIGVLFPII